MRVMASGFSSEGVNGGEIANAFLASARGHKASRGFRSRGTVLLLVFMYEAPLDQSRIKKGFRGGIGVDATRGYSGRRHENSPIVAESLDRDAMICV